MKFSVGSRTSLRLLYAFGAVHLGIVSYWSYEKYVLGNPMNLAYVHCGLAAIALTHLFCLAYHSLPPFSQL